MRAKLASTLPRMASDHLAVTGRGIAQTIRAKLLNRFWHTRSAIRPKRHTGGAMLWTSGAFLCNCGAIIANQRAQKSFRSRAWDSFWKFRTTQSVTIRHRLTRRARSFSVQIKNDITAQNYRGVACEILQLTCSSALALPFGWLSGFAILSVIEQFNASGQPCQ